MRYWLLPSRAPTTRSLNLSHNNLDGTLPSSVLLLKQLTLLDISYNGFTGTLPNLLNNLTSLVYAHLLARRAASVPHTPSCYYTLFSLFLAVTVVMPRSCRVGQCCIVWRCVDRVGTDCKSPQHTPLTAPCSIASVTANNLQQHDVVVIVMGGGPRARVDVAGTKRSATTASARPTHPPVPRQRRRRRRRQWTSLSSSPSSCPRLSSSCWPWASSACSGASAERERPSAAPKRRLSPRLARQATSSSRCSRAIRCGTVSVSWAHCVMCE